MGASNRSCGPFHERICGLACVVCAAFLPGIWPYGGLRLLLFDFAGPFADHFGRVYGAIDNCAGYVVAPASIHDEIDLMSEQFFNHLGVNQDFLLIFQGQGGAEDGMAEFAEYGLTNGMVGYANTDGFAFGAQNFGHFFAGFQNKGIRAGQVLFQKAVQWRADGLGILAEVAEVAAQEGELHLEGIDAFNLADALNGFGVLNAAADAIDRIGGINDDPAFSQGFHQDFNLPFVRIFRMNL